MLKSAGRAPFLRVLPWHLPYNWEKNTKKPQSGLRTLVLVIKKNNNKYFPGTAIGREFKKKERKNITCHKIM